MRTCLTCHPSLDAGDCSAHPCLTCGTHAGTCCKHCLCRGEQEHPNGDVAPVIAPQPPPPDLTHLSRCTCRECARSEVTREDYAS